MSTSDTPTGQRAANPVNLDQDQRQQNPLRQAPQAGQQQYAQPNDPRQFNPQAVQNPQGGQPHPQPANPLGMQVPQYQTPQSPTPQYQAPQPQQPYQGAPQGAAPSAQAGIQPQYRQPAPQQPQSYQAPQPAHQSAAQPTSQPIGQPTSQPTSQQSAGYSPTQYASTSQSSLHQSSQHQSSQQRDGAAANAQGSLSQALSGAQPAPQSYLNQQPPSTDAGSDQLSRYSPSDFFSDIPNSTNTPENQQRSQMFGANSANAGQQTPPASGYSLDPAPSSTQNTYDAAQPPYSDQRQTLNAFQSSYDQEPDAGLNAYSQKDYGQFSDAETAFATSDQGDASFYDGEYSDEEFDEETGARRNMLLIGVLVGALGIGGALAYAYKSGGIGGNLTSAGSPPVISASNDPVKFKPKNAGGKSFPNGNKMFYDRLRDGGQTKTASVPERIISRQESVLNSAKSVGTLGQTAKPVITGATPKPKNLAGKKINAPRKVQTLTVLPDGRIIKAKPKASAVKVTSPQIPTMKSTKVAAVKAKVAAPTKAIVKGGSVPTPVAKKSAAPAQFALATPQRAATPAPAALATTGFVVQVAARRNQTDALEAFANLQAKYPTILSAYQPIIQRADLGNKGVWYRLRVGPMGTKESAGSVCSKLKEAGLKSCIVNAL